MSEKLKWPAIEASRVSDQLIAELAPVCERICFAGSLRRRKPEVGDLELLYIPKFEDVQDPGSLIPATIRVNLADEQIAHMEIFEVLKRRKNVNGSEMFGEKNKLMVHCASGLPVDLFSTTAENWWVSLVIRTGSLETNLKLTNGANARGGHLQAYGSGVKWGDGHVSEATSEKAVFDLCGVPYLEPESR